MQGDTYCDEVATYVMQGAAYATHRRCLQQVAAYVTPMRHKLPPM